jgi:hypothetical protein
VIDVSSFGTASGVAISAQFVSHGPSPKVRQTPSFIFSGSEIPIQSYHHGICVFDCRRRSPCCNHDHLDLRPLPFAVHLNHNADAHICSKKGVTPLHNAAARGYYEVTKTLLMHNVEVNSRDDERATPLLKASESGHACYASLSVVRRGR